MILHEPFGYRFVDSPTELNVGYHFYSKIYRRFVNDIFLNYGIHE